MTTKTAPLVIGNDSAGRINAVTDNAMHVSSFTYEQELMTTIRDENGGVSEHLVADSGVYHHRYVVNREGQAQQTMVTVPDGTGTALTFDHGRLVSRTSIQGF
jgi:hypothetical protein